MDEPDDEHSRHSFSGAVLVWAIAAMVFVLAVLALVLAFTTHARA